MSSLKIVGQEAHDHSHGEESGACKLQPEVHVLVTDKGPVDLGSVNPRNFSGRAAIVTLGCAKNHVDSEVMLGVLTKRGFEIVSDIKEADVAIVNTCGFLQSAVQESIDCILEIAELKKTGRLRKLVVAGCAVERYSDPSGKNGSIQEALPEVDRFISVNQILEVAEAANISGDGTSIGNGIDQVLEAAARPYFLYDDTMPRQLATKSHMAYVKVGEGCNRPCTFCIIPKIRGTMRSRTVDSVVREVHALSQMGVREVNLVAQDLTSYGLDLKKEDGTSSRQLTELLQALDASKAVDWIRLLYAYPIGIDEALLDAIRDLPRVVEYLDLPLQHASEAVLARMKRPLGRYSPRKIVELIRRRAPQLALRTTFIVGFPGETDADIKELETFIREGHFASVGIFTYSPELGTPAHDLEDQVPERSKKSRRDRLMKAQQEILTSRMNALIGQQIQVLIEGSHEETELLVVGRARFQAPEVDGIVIINDAEGLLGGESLQMALQPGSMVTVEVTEVAGYDLIGRVVARDSKAPLAA